MNTENVHPMDGTQLTKLPGQGHGHFIINQNKEYFCDFAVIRGADLAQGFFFSDNKNINTFLRAELIIDKQIRSTFDPKNSINSIHFFLSNVIFFFDKHIIVAANPFSQLIVRCWFSNDCCKHIGLYCLYKVLNMEERKKVTNPNYVITYKKGDEDIVCTNGKFLRNSPIKEYMVPVKDNCVTLSGHISMLTVYGIPYDGSVNIKVGLNDLEIYDGRALAITSPNITLFFDENMKPTPVILGIFTGLKLTFSQKPSSVVATLTDVEEPTKEQRKKVFLPFDDNNEYYMYVNDGMTYITK